MYIHVSLWLVSAVDVPFPPLSTDGHQQRATSQESDKLTPPPGDGDPNAWFSTRKMIFVKPSTKSNVPTGFWPIPESFWPDSSLSKLVCYT